ncbi:MAG: RHS repeat-associated core domain-containing protein, partial [Methylococcales bacterium]|nr:RHS repeat-associated core domain-containing protein [Methylococcales bacterium]
GEYDSNNTARQETVWLGDTPVAVVTPDPVTQQPHIYFIETDHLNTPRVILNSAHTPIWRWDSDAFGQGQPNEDPDGDGQTFEYNLRFPGQYYDRETGLHYNYFRDYEPETGRYIESDPIGLEAGLNTYTYVNSNPLTYIDPTGENPLAVGAAAIRYCMRIPRCAALLAPLIKKAAEICKSVECELRFDREGHPFIINGKKLLCMHYQIDCHVKGIKGSGFSTHSRLPICWKPGGPFVPNRPSPTLP